MTTENSRTGYEKGQFPNRVVLRRDTKTKLLIFVFSFDYNNKLNESIRSWGCYVTTK